MSIKVRYSVHTVRVKLSTPCQSSTSSWVCIVSCTTFRTRVYRMRTRRRRRRLLSIFPKLSMNAKKPKRLETTNKPLRKPSESLIVPPPPLDTWPLAAALPNNAVRADGQNTPRNANGTRAPDTSPANSAVSNSFTSFCRCTSAATRPSARRPRRGNSNPS